MYVHSCHTCCRFAQYSSPGSCFPFAGQRNTEQLGLEAPHPIDDGERVHSLGSTTSGSRLSRTAANTVARNSQPSLLAWSFTPKIRGHMHAMHCMMEDLMHL